MTDEPVEFRSAEELGKLPAHTTVARGVEVSDRDLEGLERLTSLTTLHLDGCFDLGDEALARIGRHAPLEILFISGNGISDDGLRHLAGLSALRELGLDAPVTGSGFRHLPPLPRLATIHLPAGPRLEAEGLEFLATLPALETLCFYSCPRIRDEWLTPLAGSPSLRTLRLFRCEGVTEEGAAALGARNPELAVERM